MYLKYEELKHPALPVTTRVLMVLSLRKYTYLFLEGDPSRHVERVCDWIYRWKVRPFCKIGYKFPE